MSEAKAISLIELDVPHCDETFGVGNCRARLGYVDNPTDFVAASFGGSTTIERGAGLTGAADSKLFTVNAWFRRASAAADAVLFAGVTTVNGSTARLNVYLEQTTNKLVIKSASSAGTSILEVKSSAIPLAGMHHVVASFDLSDTAKRHLYIDGVADLATVTTYSNTAIDLTLADWGVAGYPAGTSRLTGELGDLWFEDGLYIDLSVEANLRKWIGQYGNPVDLGADGSTPTGAAPILYHGRDIDSFGTNHGTGGAMALSGAAPTETVPATARKCFNSLGTCADRDSFDDVPTTMRFARPSDYLVEAGIDIIEASITDIEYSPAIISLGEGLGQRASLRVTLRDHPFEDTGDAFDKYPESRDYWPYGRGTFWGKNRARNPYLRGRPIRKIEGLLGEALGDMETRHLVVESFEGPSLAGRFTLVSKDPLKFAAGDRAQAPLLNTGKLVAGIDADDMSATLTPTGIGDEEYAASGWMNIGGKEVIGFTRSGDVLTITSRHAFGTTAVSHEAGDKCQQCLYVQAEDPADIAYLLFTGYTQTPASYITLADWQAETAAYYRRVNTALIVEPTSVEKLLSELIEQVGLAIWWDDKAQKIRLQVLRAISTDAETFDARNAPGEANVEEMTLEVREQPRKRISRVQTFFGLKSPFEPLDEPWSYRSSALTPDLDGEDNDGKSIKTIYSRWIPFGGLTAAARVNQILLGRYQRAPRHFSFKLSARGDETPELGEGCRIIGLPMQDATGDYENVPAQIIRLNRKADRWEIEAEEMRFVDLSEEEDLSVHPITIDASINDINLRSLHDTLFPAPVAKDTVNVVVNTGVIVGSSSTATPAFTVGSWPTQSVTGNRTATSPVISGLGVDTATWAKVGQQVFGDGIPARTKILSIDSSSQVTLDKNATTGSGTSTALTVHTVIVNLMLRGRVQGKGGAGGDGGYAPPQGPSNHQDGFPGLPGGPALYTRYAINLALDVGDSQVFGGGGGGGGSTYAVLFSTSRSGPGGGGGGGSAPGAAGVLNNANGLSIAFDTPAAPGTTEVGGRGGYSSGSPSLMPGGDGGGPGLPGASGGTNNSFTPGAGGAAGGAIDGVSYIVKTGAGDIRGTETN